MGTAVIVRTATEGDAGALAAIYGHHVVHGVGTFETQPPSAAEMDARRRAVAERGLPYLVGEAGGRIVGFAYAGPFRLREAYRYTVEDSVYVAADCLSRGVGRTLLGALLDACETLGMRQMVALIGDSGNAGSIALHRSLGFELAGVGRGLGFKQGRWLDVVWMQKALGDGASGAPDGPSVPLR